MLKTIPPQDIREHPELINGMTANGQWQYSRRRAMPKLPVKGLPSFPCPTNDLLAFFAGQSIVKNKAKDLTPSATPAILTHTVGKLNTRSKKGGEKMAKATTTPKRGRGRPPVVIPRVEAALKASRGKAVTLEASSFVAGQDQVRKINADPRFRVTAVSVTYTVARKRAPRKASA